MGRKAHDLPTKGWKLWTRGGTTDVTIRDEAREIEVEIPAGLLRDLVAEDIRADAIRNLEQYPTGFLLRQVAKKAEI